MSVQLIPDHKLREGVPCLYRIEESGWQPGWFCAETETVGGGLKTQLRLVQLQILSPTPKGFWVRYRGQPKWVSSTSRKRLAYPTPDEALAAYKVRKLRQLEIVELQYRQAKALAEAAKTLQVEDIDARIVWASQPNEYHV